MKNLKIIAMIIIVLNVACTKEVTEYKVVRQQVPVYQPPDTIIPPPDTVILKPKYRDYPVFYDFHLYTVEKLSIADYKKWERRNVGKMQLIDHDLIIMDILDIKSDPVIGYGWKFDSVSINNDTMSLYDEQHSYTQQWEILIRDLFNEQWQRIEYTDTGNFLHTIQVKITREEIQY